MVWLLDQFLTRGVRSFGWQRVALSQVVWDRCVRVPEGVVCPNQDLRLGDVIAYLVGALFDAPRHDDTGEFFFVYRAEVVNDERDHWDGTDRDWPSSAVWMVAQTGYDDEGSRCLIVTALDEAVPLVKLKVFLV